MYLYTVGLLTPHTLANSLTFIFPSAKAGYATIEMGNITPINIRVLLFFGQGVSGAVLAHAEFDFCLVFCYTVIRCRIDGRVYRRSFGCGSASASGRFSIFFILKNKCCPVRREYPGNRKSVAFCFFHQHCNHSSLSIHFYRSCKRYAIISAVLMVLEMQ